MDKKGNPILRGNARALRKSMTKEEKHLWYDYLKHLSPIFNRQKIIGMYIVDFYCPAAKLVVELDGSQHYTDDGVTKDLERDHFLEKQGILVLRYSNYDFHRNFDGICADISMHVKERLS